MKGGREGDNRGGQPFWQEGRELEQALGKATGRSRCRGTGRLRLALGRGTLPARNMHEAILTDTGKPLTACKSKTGILQLDQHAGNLRIRVRQPVIRVKFGCRTNNILSHSSIVKSDHSGDFPNDRNAVNGSHFGAKPKLTEEQLHTIKIRGLSFINLLNKVVKTNTSLSDKQYSREQQPVFGKAPRVESRVSPKEPKGTVKIAMADVDTYLSNEGKDLS